MSVTDQGQAAREPAETFAGVPDALQRLWTPHRMAYIDGDDRPADDGETGCPFCAAPGRSDADGLIVHRGESAYVVLNLYPYNPGHMLVCPYRHVADYTELDDPETAELTGFARKAMRVIRHASSPHGFNIGMNQGAVAGAGIAAHLHQHVVPRWGGDTNFMTTVGETKVLPEMLADTAAKLKPLFDALGDRPPP